MRPSVCIAVLCHNEERRIGACLASLLRDSGDATIHVVVNGSSDRTAARARAIAAPTVKVHEFVEGGKARSWNRFVFDTLPTLPDVLVFVDGDAEIAPGSIDALVEALARDSHAHVASGMPRNGRRAEAYRAEMRDKCGLFGDLYAVKGNFLARMKAAGVRLPDDLIGDDSLIGAMAKTDLGRESAWDDARVAVCETAGFYCEPVRLAQFGAIRMQYRRMINYSVRHFQSRIVTRIMRDVGPTGLPRRMASAYGRHADLLVARKALPWRYFDRVALARIRAAAE